MIPSGKLLRILIVNPILSIQSPLNFTRAYRLCKSVSRILISKALNLLFSMDDTFYLGDDFLDVSRSPTLTLAPLAYPSTSLSDEDDYDERVYLVSYRWWKTARESLYGERDDTVGVLYTTSPDSSKIVEYGVYSEFILSMSRKDIYFVNNDEGNQGTAILEYALVPEATWVQALKWYDDISRAEVNPGGHLDMEEYIPDVFPLQIRLSVELETNSLVVKISEKDNPEKVYRRALNILGVESKQLHIWDFSRQIALLFKNETTKFPYSNRAEADIETVLHLQVYELPNSMSSKEGIKEEMRIDMFGNENSFYSCSLKMNGSVYDWTSSIRNRSRTRTVMLGLRGLRNLGNTCFMNSAIQCLVHSPMFVKHFLGDYTKEINRENPLGMRGELASTFGELLRKLWIPGTEPVVPRMFKFKISSFAPQFGGYNQHDSQEFLAFLLDGLHEDLNRVKSKPYIEARNADGLPDEEIADEYWQNHRARNDSVIVDLLQGQYRSTLICPVCKKVSVTFDPFMYLSLPVPSTTMRTMTVTVFSTDGTTLPTPVTVIIPMSGICKDLIQALSDACSLRGDETLYLVEIFNHKIINFLDDPTAPLDLVTYGDKLVAYRLPIETDSSTVVFLHYRGADMHVFHMRRPGGWKIFGTPLVTRISHLSSGSDLQNQFLKLISLFSATDLKNAPNDDDGCTDGEYSVMDDGTATPDDGADLISEDGRDDPPLSTFQFHYGTLVPEETSKIEMNGPLRDLESGRLEVSVCWPDEMLETYDASPLCTLPNVLANDHAQESVPFYKCLELFLKEEPLGPEDMWYCPTCKEHQQASKKLDLWRFPEVLVIHLKRFSYDRYSKTKLETFVDFPIRDLDLSDYVAHKEKPVPHHYMLYAVINHYGGMGGGHYTASVQRECGRWFVFDDDRVQLVSEDEIKTSAAYVLFYRRTSNSCL